MTNRYFHKDGGVAAFSDLQISEGAAEGLRELSQHERETILNPAKALTALAIKATATQKRWEVETGGITLPTGVSVATGIDDQNRITSVVANAERAAVDSVDFKAESGWVRVTLEELRGIAVAIARHVQACFSAERAHHEAIDALVAQYEGDAEGLQAALGSYDIESGWPSVNPQQA